MYINVDTVYVLYIQYLFTCKSCVPSSYISRMSIYVSKSREKSYGTNT